MPTSKLSPGVLTALVIGSMIGSGIFNLPQNMAAKAGVGAILIGWLITGIGMLMLCFVYEILAIRRPSLNNGVYAYAQACAGDFVGFNSAWGYWVSAWLGNVSYLIAIFASLGYFFPIFGEGNTTIALISASIILWVMHFFILKGIKSAAFLNVIITIAKVVPLFIFIIFVAFAFQYETFTLNFWGNVQSGSMLTQVKNTMLITVWVFIGIEGASVYSARAKQRRDIGTATLNGFIITLSLLIAVSVLSLGILSQTELAALKNLSMASVLEKVTGRWGAIVMLLGLSLSAGGALLAWTLLAAEALFTPAKEGLMPRVFSQENRGVPVNTLWLTNSLIQLFLLLTWFSKVTYLALITLSTSMILMPYFFSALYAVKMTMLNETYINEPRLCRRNFCIALLATIYCGWLLYAAGFKYLFLSALLYIIGSFFYIIAKYQHDKPVFQPFERIIMGCLIVLSVIAAYLLYSGTLTL